VEKGEGRRAAVVAERSETARRAHLVHGGAIRADRTGTGGGGEGRRRRRSGGWGLGVWDLGVVRVDSLELSPQPPPQQLDRLFFLWLVGVVAVILKTQTKSIIARAGRGGPRVTPAPNAVPPNEAADAGVS